MAHIKTQALKGRDKLATAWVAPSWLGLFFPPTQGVALGWYDAGPLALTRGSRRKSNYRGMLGDCRSPQIHRFTETEFLPKL